MIAVCVVLLTVGYIGQLFILQVVNGEAYGKEADARFVALDSTEFDRGTIYFRERTGDLVSAATLKERFIIAINPSELVNIEDAYVALNSVASTSREQFMVAALKKDDPYEIVGGTGSREISQKINELKVRGLATYRTYDRYYPAGSLAAHVLGFLAKTKDSGDELIGRYGLEQEYNDTLARSGEQLFVNAFASVFANISASVAGDVTEEDYDIVTTIEPTVQAYVESELADILDTYSAKVAGAIVINPKTGEIYAMAGAPTFNPNSYGNVESASVYLNPFVQHVYEMGSVFKPLTIAAGIDAGVITPETTYNDVGVLSIDGYKVSNYDGRGRGVVSMQEVLSQSLNTGTVFVAEELGAERFREYFNRYRLSNITGIELPGEEAGLTENLSSPRAIERATASFGQGIAFSPIVFTQALTAFANDGAMVRPRIIKALRKKDGTLIEKEPIVVGLPISPETADTVTQMLVEVVDDALLGGTVSFDDYSIAAKTGTAQISNPAGGYYDDRYLHTFFGYFPAYKPEFLVFLFVNEPQGELYASHTLTYPFMRIAEFLLNYYEVPPDRATQTKSPVI